MTYVTTSDRAVPVTRIREFEELERERIGVLGRQSGFITGSLNRDLGHPGRYGALIQFSGQEEWESAVTSAEYRAARDRRPEGLVTVLRPLEAYEPVVVVAAEREFWFGLTATVILDSSPGNAARYEARQRELFALRKQVTPGFCGNRIFRFLGDLSKYYETLTYDTLEHARVANDPLEVQAYLAAHPLSAYTSLPPEVHLRQRLFTVRG